MLNNSLTISLTKDLKKLNKIKLTEINGGINFFNLTCRFFSCLFTCKCFCCSNKSKEPEYMGEPVILKHIEVAQDNEPTDTIFTLQQNNLKRTFNDIINVEVGKKLDRAIMKKARLNINFFM